MIAPLRLRAGRRRSWMFAALGCSSLGFIVFADAMPASAKPLEVGASELGTWEVIWRYDEANGVRSAYADLGPTAPPFPVRWRVLRDTRGDRLQFFDDLGMPVRQIPLEAQDRALGADDRNAWVVFSPNPKDVVGKRIRYYRPESKDPIWQAFAPGEPALFSADGNLLVLATRTEQYDRFSRLIDEGAGRVDFLGGEAGELRGSLPTFPKFVRSTGDGRHVAVLREQELFLMGTDGRLVWKRDVPIDNLIARGGLSHLATGGRYIAVCGTGDEPDPQGLAGTLHPIREEHLVVFDLAGRTVWNAENSHRDELRFHYSCALSQDGETLATLHATERDEVVTTFETASGVEIAENRARRRSGAETLSVAPHGEMTCLVFGDQRSYVVAWDREGRLFWEGQLPFRCQMAVAVSEDLIAAEHWIVRLVPKKK